MSRPIGVMAQTEVMRSKREEHRARFRKKAIAQTVKVKSSDGNKSAEARRINDVKANEMIYRTLGSTGEMTKWANKHRSQWLGNHPPVTNRMQGWFARRRN